MYDIIKHMYEETTASVKHQGMLSDIFECNLGVRQGKVFHRFSLPILKRLGRSSFCGPISRNQYW